VDHGSQPGAAAADPGTPAVPEPPAICKPGVVPEPGATAQTRAVPEPPAHSEPAAQPEPAAKPPRSGRNLPVAAGVGAVLGGIVVLTLFTVKATFLIVMAAAAVVALWELARSLGSKDIHAPFLPVAAGGAAMWVCEYWWSDRAVLASLVLTVVVILAWRLPGDTDGYLRDVAAGVFVLAYVPLMAVFMVAMLAPADGARRVLLFVVLTICSDIGGYFAGSRLGRHPMAPIISPNKTWEGSAGSVLACLVAGAVLLPVLLHGHVWQGILTGAGAVTAAILGDLAESAIKRDLQIKDMGSVLPGHGGILDRIDSLLVTAPVIWLLLAVFIPARQ